MRRLRAPIVGVGVAVLVTIAFGFLLYQPKSDEQAVLEEETAALQDQQQTLRGQIAQLQEVRDREAEIRAGLARLQRHIPDGLSQPSLIRQLQKSADRAGVEITSLTFDQPQVPVPAEGAAPVDTGEPGTTLANIPVTMVLEGGYFQVVDFFRRLEVDVPRAALVQRLTVAEAQAEFPTLTVTWGGQLFAVVPAEGPGDVEGTDQTVPQAPEGDGGQGADGATETATETQP